MSGEIHDPIQRMRVTVSHEGETAVIETRVEPGGRVPKHSHPTQAEIFTVHSGTVRFKVGRAKVDAGPGDVVDVPPGTKHSFRNRSGEEASFTARLTPGLHAENFFLDAAAMGNDGLVTKGGLPKSWRGLLRGAQLLRRYREEVVIYSPPPFLQRLFVPPLLHLARSNGAKSPDWEASQ
jgi:quercetin dioxygenase-like cupin family protein